MSKVTFTLFLPTGDYAAARATAEWADAQGFHGVAMNDHYFSPLGKPQDPQLECFALLSALAVATKRVRLVSTVAAMSFRHPALLAKIASTLDHVSGGRLVLGLGAGWQPSEYHAHGIPYPSNLERLEQLREGIEVLKAMWTQDEPTYRGRTFQIDKAYNNPRPVQKPHPPIMIGGSGSRLLPIVAAHADIANLIPPITNGKDLIQDPAAAVKFDKANLKRRIDTLKRLVREAGRPEGAVELSGLALVGVGADRATADATAQGITAQMGFPSVEAARQSPSLLLGTPDEVTREIRSRNEELGISNFVVFMTSREGGDLFASQVMPAFR